MGLLLTSGSFCGAGDGAGEVCTPVDTIFPGLCGTGSRMEGFDTLALSLGAEVFLTEVDLDTPAEGALDRGFGVGADSVLEIAGSAKASSARACVTFLLIASCFGPGAVAGPWPNSNFWPRSCSNENSSRDGNRAANSSAAALRTWTFCESRAANGSEVVPLIGEGLGLAAGGCCTGPVGLPLRIGAISGML